MNRIILGIVAFVSTGGVLFADNLSWAREQCKAIPSPEAVSVDFLSPKEERQDAEEDLFSLLLQDQQREPAGIDFNIPSGALEDPKGAIGVVRVETEELGDDGWTDECDEKNVYVTVHQTLAVELQGSECIEAQESGAQIKRCKGHEEIRPGGDRFFVRKTKAEAAKSRWEAQLRQDPTIDLADSLFRVHVENDSYRRYFPDWPAGAQGWRVHAEYRHYDNAVGCDCFEMVSTGVAAHAIAGSIVEQDTWVSDRPELLAKLKSGRGCSFLRAIITEGPGTKTIEGRPVFREVWGRDLLLVCEEEDSRCRELKDKGGVLVEQRCLAYNPLGECDHWHKVYKKPSVLFQKRNHVFEDGRTFFGLHGEFHQPKEAGSDFEQVTPILSLLEGGLQYSRPPSATQEELSLFSGAALACHCRCEDHGIPDDCCKKVRRDVVDREMAGCSREEKMLAALRDENRCHHVGQSLQGDSSSAVHVFCCFPSEQARILLEHVRKGEWGTPDEPRCGGLTLEELQQARLEEIRFEEKPFHFENMNEEIQSFFQSKLQQGVELHEKS